MKNIYLEALDLAGYELEDGVELEIQFRNMFIDCVDGGMWRDIRSEEEADDFIEEVGLEKVARMMIGKMRRYGEFKRMVGIG